MNTLEIIWKAIKDIENGLAKTIDEDPLEGFLLGKNKKLTKMNISYQTAKYTDNGKCISRPTIDSYQEITEYLENPKKEIVNTKEKEYLKEIKELKEKIRQLEEDKKNLAIENYKLSLLK